MSSGNERSWYRYALAVAIWLFGLLGPAACLAAIVDFDSPLTSTGGSIVIDKSLNLMDGGAITKLDITFANSNAVELAMDSAFTLNYEHLSFKMTNATGANIDSLLLSFMKPLGSRFTVVPDVFDWVMAVSDYSGDLLVDARKISLIAMPSDSPNQVVVEMPFGSVAAWRPNMTIYFGMIWEDFNSPRDDWLLTLDLNGQTAEEELITPIPGGAWLFASGLVGLFATRRQRRSA